MKITRHVKNFAFFLLALVAIIGTAVSVSADSNDYSVNYVKVNGLTMDASTTLDVERGERLDIEVYLDANNSADDVTVTARIMGYEFGSISDSTSQFNLDAGKTYKKTLTLYVPEDIDASEDYTLKIEVSDQLDEVEVEYTLHIDEARHGLKIYDVLLNPGSTVASGNPLFVTVRLENLGELEENDIKVTVAIPDLGVSTINYFDELNTEAQESDTGNNYDQDNSDQMDLLIRIPEGAETGTYELKVDVEYNRGHNFLSQSLDVNVQGNDADAGVQTVVNSDSSSKATSGEAVEYKVMIANLGEEPGVYSVQLDGISSWGEATVQPSFLTVLPDSTGEVVVTVTPFDSTEDSTYTWVSKIMLGTDTLSEVVFTTKVEGAENSESDSTKTVLTVIFAVLVVVLIVLALIIAFRRVRDDDEEESSLEGQTYYQYYPKQ